mgnify:CR=1 FL=1
MSFHVKRVTDWDELWQTFEECPFAYPVAGGTDIIPRVNQGIEKHEQFVCLEGLPDMRGVSFEADGSVRIGALTKLVEISENEALAQYGGLREAPGSHPLRSAIRPPSAAMCCRKTDASISTNP